jgi:hypothetical protein
MGRCIRYNIMRYNLWHVGGFLRVLWFPPPIKLTTEIVEILLKMTLNIIASISWRSVLLVEEIGVLGENHRPVASHWQTLSHNVVSSTHRQARGSNSQSLELRIRQSWNDNNKRAGYIPWFYLLSKRASIMNWYHLKIKLFGNIFTWLAQKKHNSSWQLYLTC